MPGLKAGGHAQPLPVLGLLHSHSFPCIPFSVANASRHNNLLPLWLTHAFALPHAVMLSAGFCHLLAESLPELSFIGEFPMATFLAALGYLVTLMADQLVQALTETTPGAAEDSMMYSSIQMTDPYMSQSKYAVGSQVLQTEIVLADAPSHRSSLHDGAAGDAAPKKETQMDLLLPISVGRVDSGAVGGADTRVSPTAHAPDLDQPHVCSNSSSQPADHNAAIAVFTTRKKLSFATALLLAAALCVHSILEGMALGSQTSMTSTEDIFIAIVAHKGLAAYALGGSVIESGASDKRFWTVIGLFSLATPFGIFVGYGVSNVSDGVGGAALSALASGTFLYVAMMEIIPKELADSRHRFLKMAMLLVGFGLMSLLAVWA